MKSKIYLSSLLILTAICGIACGSQKKPVDCESNLEKAAYCVNNYYFNTTPQSLDSALVYLNEIKNRCPEYENVLNLRLVQVYYLKGEFKKAVKILKNNDFGENPDYPGLKNIWINQIQAKEARINGKQDLEQKYYSNIISALEKHLDMHKELRDSMLTLDDYWAMDNELITIRTVFSETYYYKMRLYGKQRTFKELDSIRQALNGNEYYFESLKKSLEGKDGHSISIMFD